MSTMRKAQDKLLLMKSIGIRTTIKGVVHELYEMDEEDDWGNYPWRIRYDDHTANLPFLKTDQTDKLFWLPIHSRHADEKTS